MKLLHIVFVLPFFLNYSGDEPECRKLEEGLYLYSALNEVEQVESYLDSLASCGNDSPESLLSIGRYYYNRAEYAMAELSLQRVIDDKISSQKQLGEAHYYFGLSCYYSSNSACSNEHNNAAFKYGYKPEWCLNNLGLVQSDEGNYDQAITYYWQALSYNKDYDMAYNNIAVAYDGMRQYLTGLKYHLIADSLTNGTKPLYLSNLGRNYRDRDMIEKQGEIARKGYKLFPGNKRFIYDLGSVLCREGKYNEALKSVQELIALDPSSAREWYSVAYLYDVIGYRDSAFYFHNVTLRYNPNESRALHSIGMYYRENGQFEKAHEYYDKAIAVNPLNDKFYNSKIGVYLWERNFEKALEWSKKYCNMFEQGTYCPLNMGYNLLQLQRYSDAIPWLEKKLEVKPKDDRANNNLGRCYWGLGQYDQSLEYFEKALAINPNNSYTYHNRAALYNDLQMYDEACQDLQTSMDLEYTWTIDEKLLKMRDAHCKNIKTDRNILIHAYSGNVKELEGKHSFIQLSGSTDEIVFKEELIPKTQEIFQQNKDRSSSTVFDSFKVYPNPSSGVFNVKCPVIEDAEMDIRLYDATGQLVLTKKVGSGETTSFDISGLAGGNYVVMILDSKSVLSANKILLSK
ncbi:MAG: tetratricopeptide repeat protein [Flavobacteriales bacterium]|nr:tetratricopeptide repeat protein [Flavobacteriales bacterium]